jgi:alpha-L-fucosidase 2
MKKNGFIICLMLFLFLSLQMISGYQSRKDNTRDKKHDFHFSSIPVKWDEGLPLGNGMLGALIWQKGNSLRFALDRADLWDLRSAMESQNENYKFSWVINQVSKNDYEPVQKLLDEPYDNVATPTKIPAGAIEFDIPGLNDAEYADLYLDNALAEIKLKNGIKLTSFVSASSSYGWIKIEGLEKEIKPRIDPPPFMQEKINAQSNSGPEGNDLKRLGYPEPVIKENRNEIIYTQKCYDDYEFQIRTVWQYRNKILYCMWTITTNRPYPLFKESKTITAKENIPLIFQNQYMLHTGWWKKYWNKSSIQIPDSFLETQWYRELYKFGSTSREGAPAVTLQAVWTADNRRLPPWKGDFHNDLNTQLSYWPSYSSNHLEEAGVFIDWILYGKQKAIDYTKKFFGVEGLNFPGVSTIDGDAMGGWSQYSLSPTVGAWISHHFYLQWRYSMDKKFLEDKAYPWITKAADFITNISLVESGKRKLPLSSSPEINDNRITAWFKETTNYDLALIRWLYQAAGEMALALNKNDEAQKWSSLLAEWPQLSVDDNGLLVAPGFNLKESHRHFSHLMAIHPLGLLNYENEKDKNIIDCSLQYLDKLGTDLWCGYSYSWLGSMYARALNGNKAAEALRTFASCFCSPNSFHLNGDQSKTGKSKFTYRPFTLEGNFAFAEGIQEMLLQSQNNLVKIFPAVPDTWKNISFNNLRAEGAFIISAAKKEGRMNSITVLSEKGGKIRIKNSFGGVQIKIGGKFKSKTVTDSYIEIETKKGKEFTVKFL